MNNEIDSKPIIKHYSFQVNAIMLAMMTHANDVGLFTLSELERDYQAMISAKDMFKHIDESENIVFNEVYDIKSLSAIGTPVTAIFEKLGRYLEIRIKNKGGYLHLCFYSSFTGEDGEEQLHQFCQRVLLKPDMTTKEFDIDYDDANVEIQIPNSSELGKHVKKYLSERITENGYEIQTM